MEREGLDKAFVLDSSVVIKWFSEEIDTNRAIKLRDKFLKGEIDITVPDLQLYEIPNALRYNQKLTENDVINAVESLMDMGINIIVPTREVMAFAVELAFKLNITLYDAYFVALAKTLKYTFITSDQKLYHKIKDIKFVKLLGDLN